MRPIKFRGKNKEYREWVYGDLLRRDLDGGWDINYYDEVFGWNCDEVHETTVGQFIGLKDLNGREIYEGDIVDLEYKFKDPFEDDALSENTDLETCVVTYEDCEFRFKIEEDLSYSLYDVVNITVIGNIHDNPELMKGVRNENM